MKINTCGIITEYNPLHLGHHYQLHEAKSITDSERTVLIMSGNFVQRGEPAILNKYARATAALKSGVDLVIELPAYFATSSAEYFSHYAVKLLHEIGITTHLNYGSESGQIDGLKTIASILCDEPLGFKVLLNDLLKEGHSFPKSRAMALRIYNDHHNIFNPDILSLIETPNNILGIEYIKALIRLDSKIIPTTIKRIGSTYHDGNSEVAIPSATAIRKHLYESHPLEELKSKVPEASYDALTFAINNQQGPIFYNDIFDVLKYKLLSTPRELLSTYQDVTEGLENRIVDAAIVSYSYDELITNIVSKRYTRTKIARALLHIYLGHTKENFNSFFNAMDPYIRVLGFTPTGQKMLKEIKAHNEDLSLIVNVKQGYKHLNDLQKQCFSADLNASLLYNHIVSTKYGTNNKNDYQCPVIML